MCNRHTVVGTPSHLHSAYFDAQTPECHPDTLSPPLTVRTVCPQNGAVFTPSLAELYHLTDGGQILHVLRAGPEHSGDYSCRATSRAGTDRHNFSVNVLSERSREGSWWSFWQGAGGRLS